jgi:two-component system, cell cycle sensor histidine kinase and response regulator CckA
MQPFFEAFGLVVRRSRYGTLFARAVSSCNGAIDVTVSDVVLPGISGLRLAEELTQRFPGVRILFISGYDTGDAVGTGELGGRFDLITKPFTVSDLVDKLQEGPLGAG